MSSILVPESPPRTTDTETPATESSQNGELILMNDQNNSLPSKSDALAVSDNDNKNNSEERRSSISQSENGGMSETEKTVAAAIKQLEEQMCEIQDNAAGDEDAAVILTETVKNDCNGTTAPVEVYSYDLTSEQIDNVGNSTSVLPAMNSCNYSTPVANPLDATTEASSNDQPLFVTQPTEAEVEAVYAENDNPSSAWQAEAADQSQMDSTLDSQPPSSIDSPYGASVAAPLTAVPSIILSQHATLSTLQLAAEAAHLKLTEETRQKQLLQQQQQQISYAPRPPARNTSKTPSTRSKSKTYKDTPPSPTTPTTKVVESGREHTGRWTRDEHEAFLSALKKYGKEWKKVAARVKTRTVVQTRTHAQKYFQKLQKMMVDGGTTGPGSSGTPGSTSYKHHFEEKKLRKGTVLLPKEEMEKARQKAISKVFQQQQQQQQQQVPQVNHAVVALGQSTVKEQMSIMAPKGDPIRPPEPSPAACGKRKLAEIAAAQMLAGVLTKNPHIKNRDEVIPAKQQQQQQQLEHQTQEGRTGSSSGRVSNGLEGKIGQGHGLVIVNPERLEGGIGCKRRRVVVPGERSPSTPWDGQLEALVSNEVKSQPQSHLPHSTSNSPQNNLQLAPPHPLNLPHPTRTPLHTAVASGKPSAVARLLSFPVSLCDNMGFSPLHSAASLQSENGVEITKMLLASGADVTVVDGMGCTALHWAARCGNANVVRLLTNKNCPLDARNKDGETALHWAMRSGPTSLISVTTLLQDGARPNIFDNHNRRPLDVAALGFRSDATGANIAPELNLDHVRTMRAAFLEASVSCRTLVLHHPECGEHIPKSDRDWEVPDRIKAIMDLITSSAQFHTREITISTEFERASLELLSRVHSTEYLAFVNDLSKELEKRAEDDGEESGKVVPFTPMVQRTIMKGTVEVKKGSHSDTSFSAGSLRAARRAAGAVQHAVDCVLMNRNRNAFCVVRPPGHHAGINGLLSNSESCGFCIFNNIAAGALHALSPRHSARCERCAIVDIDVHHGNGTEEIVRQCHDPARLLFFSVHLYDRERTSSGTEDMDWKFYPGTGDEDDVARNVINVPVAPLWREKELKDATSGVTGTNNEGASRYHNTRFKKKELAARARQAAAAVASGDDKDHEHDDDNESLEKSTHGSSAVPAPPASPSPPSHYLTGMGRKAYRRAIEHRLLPALRAFNPDLILISAGFDAARGDVGNAKHIAGGREKMGLDLDPEDYAWTTQKIMTVADICCQGRVVSVLEGGYGRTPSGAVDYPLDKTLFAESAAQHLRALIDPYNTELPLARGKE